MKTVTRLDSDAPHLNNGGIPVPPPPPEMAQNSSPRPNLRHNHNYLASSPVRRSSPSTVQKQSLTSSASAPSQLAMINGTTAKGRNSLVNNNLAVKRGSVSSGAGRTPQTRRKDLALAEKRSPSGSPRNANRTSTTTMTPSKRTRTTPNRNASNTNNNTNNTTSSAKAAAASNANNRRTRPQRTKPRPPPPAQTLEKLENDWDSCVQDAEKEKFRKLWDVKTIEQGMIRIPTHLLEDLIHKESIEKFFRLEEKPVASGLFATVRKCTHLESGIEYAAKFSSRFRCGVDCSMEILHEIAMLSVCNDSNKIVHLKEVFQNRHEIILVLEYAPGGDFQSVLDEDMVPFEQDVQGFLKQILDALSFIHEKNIAHLDIKPQNIVLMGTFPNCEIKLCDLEVARVIQEGESIREIIGTPDYVAPEILSLEPVTLAADVWSLGVLAYVLLTGFSPFGGDTDQETLRNITTAQLDFPTELFEGVSEQAKDFIARCLDRKPEKRPSVIECLKHPWLSVEEEPPSPSPLMLKIPTPEVARAAEPAHTHTVEPKLLHPHRPLGHYASDTKSSAAHKISPSSSQNHLPPPSPSSGMSRRSCQTCRDRATERKRYLSKSREAIFEKVAQSNLKKSLSKSRERLCDVRQLTTLSKSRELLQEQNKKNFSRSQDKFPNFKSLSRSQEVLSNVLPAGTMKRMVNGAVSDISHAILPNVIINDGESSIGGSNENIIDFVLLPGDAKMLMSHAEMLKMNFDSLMPNDKEPLEEANNNNKKKETSIINEPLVEEDNEDDPPQPPEHDDDDDDDDDEEVKRKDEKVRSVSSLEKVAAATTTFSSVGIQVDLPRSASEPPEKLKQNCADEEKKEISKKSFSHSSTLDEKNGERWKKELAKMPKMHKKVSQLIGEFDRQGLMEEGSSKELKQKRRGSLQIEGKSTEEDENLSKEELEAKIKQIRRRSTSAILNTELNILNVTNILKETDANGVNEDDDDDEESNDNVFKASSSPSSASSVIERRKKNWEYFEIDHPKAISDKKLQQLKAKYQRRKTDSSLTTHKEEECSKDSKEEEEVHERRPRTPTRSNSVPAVKTNLLLSKSDQQKTLDLSIDPLTGQCLEVDESNNGGGTMKNNTHAEEEVVASKAAPQNTFTAGNNGSTSLAHRRNNTLSDIQEQSIPEEKILEVRIDPLTGQVETFEVPKQQQQKTKRLSVELKRASEDDGIGSLPHTPTDVSGGGSRKTSSSTGNSSCTSSWEELPAAVAHTLGEDDDEEVDEQHKRN